MCVKPHRPFIELGYRESKSRTMRISVITRFHNSESLDYLERAIISLHSQVDISVQPIVVTQRFNDQELEKVNEMLENCWYFPRHQSPILLNCSDPEPTDLRSRLINLGIQEHNKTENQFLAFLDYDDIVYSHAYKILINALNEGAAAIAFGGIELASIVPLKDYDFHCAMTKPFNGKNKVDLLHDNFCPLHSYVINTSLLKAEELYFREDLIRVEDYEFLIRVAGSNPCDFSKLETFVGCYHMRNDGSNSTPKRDGTEEDLKSEEIWKKNFELLKKYKSMAQVKFFASDF